jgi:hypothetical protein
MLALAPVTYYRHYLPLLPGLHRRRTGVSGSCAACGVCSRCRCCSVWQLLLAWDLVSDYHLRSAPPAAGAVRAAARQRSPCQLLRQSTTGQRRLAPLFRAADTRAASRRTAARCAHADPERELVRHGLCQRTQRAAGGRSRTRLIKTTPAAVRFLSRCARRRSPAAAGAAALASALGDAGAAPAPRVLRQLHAVRWRPGDFPGAAGALMVDRVTGPPHTARSWVERAFP